MINIAIVESDKELNSILFSRLKSADINPAEQFYSEKEFMNELPKLRAQIVLLDITLPCFDLIDFISTTKKLKPGIKIIIMSGWVQYDLVFKTICAGASGHINKFGDKNHLVNTIHEIAIGQAHLSLPMAQLIITKFLSTTVTVFTAIQSEIINLVASGLPSKNVAAEINQSDTTVLQHISNIYLKLYHASK